MTADDLTRRAIIAAHDAGCDRQCGEDALTFRRLTSGEQAIVALWRADRSSYYEIAEEGQGVAAAACDDRDEARAAIERALVIWREHTNTRGPGPAHCKCIACDMARALDGTEATDVQH